MTEKYFNYGPRLCRLSVGLFCKRKPYGAIQDGVFRINPQKPLEEMRQEALAAQPPAQSGEFLKPDLVALSTLDPTVHFDIRYATKNNFLGEPVYSEARAFLERPAAEVLLRVHRKLRALGYGLLIYAISVRCALFF